MNDSFITLSCPFEKAILNRVCACRHARRNSVGSRQTVQCHAQQGCQDCADTLNHIRKSASFCLGLAHAPSALPHDKAAKLQCGGLIGLQNALDQVVESKHVNDIYSLVQRALKRYGSAEELPDQHIVRSIASYNK
jgi:hypothetical protein